MSGSVWLDDGDVCLHLGDCIDVMRGYVPEVVDAIVTDPPYGLGFMGKEWDDPRPDGAHFQEWSRAWAAEAIEVLKPGGHLIAFGGTRTYHRLTCGIEDAGFEIRDCLSWLYGSGFPKSLDVSKAIDKAAGLDGTTVPSGPPLRRMIPGVEQNRTGSWIKDDGREFQPGEYTPATPEAERWQGWGTALKPAWEPAVLARKPLPGTVAANVTEHGTGALNIDGCRIGPGHANGRGRDGEESARSRYSDRGGTNIAALPGPRGGDPSGRWPANVCMDDQAAAHLDAQVAARYDNTPGPSRFFYTAKASTAERDGTTHPTVKPLALMRWLVRMVTPPGGTVLDPFAGSGTTLLAARSEGFQSIGIERDPEYVRQASHRLSQLSILAPAWPGGDA